MINLTNNLWPDPDDWFIDGDTLSELNNTSPPTTGAKPDKSHEHIEPLCPRCEDGSWVPGGWTCARCGYPGLKARTNTKL